MWRYKCELPSQQSRQQQLDMLLTTYNLVSTVKFPTRITNQSSTTIDNFFIDPSRKHSIKPIANGISDHDAQIIVLENVLMPAHKLTYAFLGTSVIILYIIF